MSYSFNVRGTSKADVKAKVEAELDKVVTSQSVHACDRDQAEAAAAAFIDIVADDDSKDIQVSVNGSVGWDRDPTHVTAASVAVSASLIART
jgi:hypothetical protein